MAICSERGTLGPCALISAAGYAQTIVAETIAMVEIVVKVEYASLSLRDTQNSGQIAARIETCIDVKGV